MATYFHGNSDIQAATPDGLQTLVLMNPTGYIPYSDTPPPAPPQSSASAGNLIFLNSAAASLAHHQHHHHHHHAPPPPQQHTFVGSANGAADVSALHHAFLPQRVHYNLWAPPPDASPAARDTPRASAASAAAQQGLSLTLSSQQLGFGSPPGGQSHAPPPPTSGESASSVSVVTNGVPGIQSVLLSSKYLKAAQELLEEVVNVGGELPKKGGGGGGSSKAVGESSGAAASGEGSGAVGSGGGGEGGSGKRAAELTPAERQDVQMKKAKLISMLEEVEQRYRQYHHQMQIVISSFEQVAGMGSARTYTALALQTISKQFRCLKDAIAGQIRAANKSLGEEDCLGGGGGGGGKMEGSRLKFVDHHLRQQRALQQLGMIQQNAWRPQRGLPERSVSVLRAWLFEHFLHPYPKDSDKHMLAKQTGLTRSQVSNWFINARVRLWKPMVEEMYLEEIKEQEQNGGSGGEKPSKSSNNNDESDSKSKEKSPGSNTNTNTNTDNQTASFTPKQDHHHHHHHALANSSTAALPQQQQYMPSGITLSSPARNHSSVGGFSLIAPSELDGITQSSPKKARCDNDHDNNNSINMLNSPSHNSHVHSMGMDVKPGSKMGNESHNNVSMKFVDSTESRQGRDGYAFMGGQANFIAGFGQYPIAEIEQFTPRFSGNNGVSLTLGLPHCDNHHLSLAGAHQSFVPNQTIQLGRRVDHHHHGIGEASHEFMGAMNTSPHPHSSSAAAAAAAFDSINIPNPKRFAAQLLPDFVS